MKSCKTLFVMALICGVAVNMPASARVVADDMAMLEEVLGVSLLDDKKGDEKKDDKKLTKCEIKCSDSGPGRKPGCTATVCVKDGKDTAVRCAAIQGKGPELICKEIKDKGYTGLSLCSGQGGQNTGKFGCNEDGTHNNKPGKGK